MYVCIMFTMLDDIFCTKPKSMTMIIHLTRLGMNPTTWLSYKNVGDIKTKRYGTTLLLVHNLISNIVRKKMGVPLVWRLKVAHCVPKIGKSNKIRCLATI